MVGKLFLKHCGLIHQLHSTLLHKSMTTHHTIQIFMGKYLCPKGNIYGIQDCRELSTSKKTFWSLYLQSHRHTWKNSYSFLSTVRKASYLHCSRWTWCCQRRWCAVSSHLRVSGCRFLHSSDLCDLPSCESVLRCIKFTINFSENILGG